jgi:hypothetical protein
LAIRAQINNTGTGTFTLINSGFVITGAGSKRVLIRAVGPTLRDFDVTDAISDQTLSLFNASGALIGFNDDWESADQLGIAAAKTITGAFALGAGRKDAGLLVSLNPDVYTARVQGSGGTTREALDEVYALAVD